MPNILESTNPIFHCHDCRHNFVPNSFAQWADGTIRRMSPKTCPICHSDRLSSRETGRLFTQDRQRDEEDEQRDEGTWQWAFLKFDAAGKYLASFFKSEWKLEDYPLRYVGRGVRPGRDDLGTDWLLVPCLFKIVNWGIMCGGGNTKEEAYADLERNFQYFIERYDKLPRPGRGSRSYIFLDPDLKERYAAVEEDFFTKILSHITYPDPGFLIWSDSATLADFVVSEEETLDKIRKVYGVDFSDLPNPLLLAVFARIVRSQGP